MSGTSVCFGYGACQKATGGEHASISMASFLQAFAQDTSNAWTGNTALTLADRCEALARFLYGHLVKRIGRKNPCTCVRYRGFSLISA